jgi:hypothetical protein
MPSWKSYIPRSECLAEAGATESISEDRLLRLGSQTFVHRRFVLIRRRLYHQLTEELLAFVRDPRNNRGDNFLHLYDRFIAPIETRLNQVRVVQMVAMVAKQYYPAMPYVPAGELWPTLRKEARLVS